jgi:hypothetical protein
MPRFEWCKDPACEVCSKLYPEGSLPQIPPRFHKLSQEDASKVLDDALKYTRMVNRMNTAATPEPKPQTNNNPHVADVVAADMLSRDLPAGMAADVMARKKIGMDKYGTALQPCNGRNNLNDLYQELVDAVKYTKTAYLEGLITGKLQNTRELEQIYDDLLEVTERVYNMLHGDSDGATP